MNIAKVFVDYLASQGKGTFGTDIFIGSLPAGAPDVCYWVTAAGGSPQSKNPTGEMVKEYVLSVFYRSTSSEQVYENMQSLEELINASLVTQLSDRIVYDMTAINFPADRDLDAQERTVGMLQVGLEIYQ